MAKVKIVQIVPIDNFTYFIDDQGRAWLKFYQEESDKLEWEQIDLPEEPES